MKYSDLKKALIAVFDSPADREAHMTMFKTRLQGLNETEEEFMLIFVKLYKAANPKVKAEDLNREVKQKFQFCNNPLDDSVSHQDKLLEMQRFIFPAVQLAFLSSVCSNNQAVLM